ncbi:ribonuclease 3-like isoform X2 [Benincasa hispida]|uniref:ribonuclease 3-like isoform X2 n=1 Tax=Benincasa hispida TaxID=102211 RepID=UPI0019014776|nr:ribonuclease 3-like isoform X2 [Benincasa hispida]
MSIQMKFHQQTVNRIHLNSPTPMLILFLLFQLLGVTISCQDIASHNSSQLISKGSGDYDFFYLVQQISLCNLKPCQKPARPTFSIYGFWPSSYGIPNCKIGTKFDPSKMLDLKNELDREWPSLEVEENEEMWKKEWERHGICSEPLLSQHAYFETALKLKQTFDLFIILANRGIFPFGEVYGLENISDAIRGATGHTPQVECKSYKHIPLLSNIFLCFQYTATSIHIVDCPLIRRCNFQAILFPFDLFGPS